MKDRGGTTSQHGKPLGNKGCLINSVIDKLQNYYRLSSRRNISNLEARMQVYGLFFIVRCQQLITSTWSSAGL